MEKIQLVLGALLLPFIITAADLGKIQGKVIDEKTGTPLPSVNVIIKGTRLGAVTDTEGRYSISKIPPGKYTLIASMVGYKKLSKIVKVLAGETITLNFELKKTVLKLEEIVVTATRTERLLKDVPASVTLITKEDIEKTSARYVDDILRDVVGVEVRRARGISSPCTHLRLRGFAHPRSTLILRDGMPVNRIACGGMKWNEFPLGIVDRVEVVRGAASSIYGSSAMGGVINIITRKPEKKPISIGADLTYGTYNTWNGGINLSGSLMDRFGYLLYYNHLETDGYEVWDYDAIREYMLSKGLDSATAEKNLSNWRAHAKPQYRNANNAFGKLTLDITPSSMFSLTYSHWDDDMGNGREHDYRVFKRDRATLGYEKKGGFLNISAGAFYLDENFTFTFDNKPIFDTIGMISEIPVGDYGGMLNISVPLGKSHLLTAGIDYRRGTMGNKSEWKTFPREMDAGGKQHRASLFIQDEMRIGRLLATLSVRGDWYKTYDGYLYDPMKGIDTTYIPKETIVVNPKLGLVYHLTDLTTLRGSIGKAFDAPYLYSLYGTFECPPGKLRIGNPEIGPEYAISYEAGIDQRFGDKLTARLTGFYNDVYDAMATILSKEKGGFLWQNIDRAKTKGIEVEAEYTPFTSLRLFANYNYLHTGIVKCEIDTSYEGNWLVDQPRHRVNFGITYSDPRIFTLALRQNYVGERYDELENVHKLEDYITWDVRFSKKIKFVEVAVEIDNITDKRYHEAWQFYTPGRTIMTRLKLSF